MARVVRGVLFLFLGRIRPAAAIGRPALRKLAASEGRIPAYRILYTHAVRLDQDKVSGVVVPGGELLESITPTDHLIDQIEN